MIQLFETTTEYDNIIVCDHCGQRIHDSNTAAAIVSKSERYPNGNVRILHICSDKCFDAVEKSQGTSSWETLSRHLRRVLYSVGLTTNKLIELEEADKKS